MNVIKVSLMLFFLALFSSALAQDKKSLRLYNSEKYCDCIERINDLPSKSKTPDVLYLTASSYYQLSIAPDNECKIKDPLSKCLNTLVKIRKGKHVDSIPGLAELSSNAVFAGIQTYRENMAQNKWVVALAMIERLKKIETNSTLLIDQAVCEFAIAKGSALETANTAFKLCKNEPDKRGEDYVLYQANNILLKLDSLKNPYFHPFMDSLLSKFSDNNEFTNSYYTHWKKEIRKHNLAHDYDFMFKTINVIFDHFPNKQTWNDEMQGIVISIADSLTQCFLDNEENFPAYIACCNLLMKARIEVGCTILPDLKNAKYYNVKSTGNNFKLNWYSASTGSLIKLRFSFDKFWKIKNEISFNAAVPGVEMQKVKGFIWVDVPKTKRAKNSNDLVQSESYNSLLLDTLSHFYCNKFRTENRKKQLSWNYKLYRASKHHSLNMANLGCIFHGEIMDSLYGLPDSINYYLDYYNPRRSSAGENCLYSFIPDMITYDSLAQKIIQMWISSPGHRENILEDGFRSESISTTFTNYSGQLAAFRDEALSTKYYPELTKLFEVFPDLKNKVIKTDISYFSSQNFRGE